jgi:hypothetical protein
MQLPLRQAAREVGINKSTLARAVASGRVSATRTEDGRLLFDPAELFRAFPPRQAATESATTQGRRETDAERQDASALEVELRLLRERLDEMRQERDRWHAEAERLSSRPLMLPAPAESAPPPRRWWPFRRRA